MHAYADLAEVNQLAITTVCIHAYDLIMWHG
jgi:hypothetical protein